MVDVRNNAGDRCAMRSIYVLESERTATNTLIVAKWRKSYSVKLENITLFQHDCYCF